MIAPFLKERWEWTDSDVCWFCKKGGQSGDHLFKDCMTWKRRIRGLWKEVGRISGGKRRPGNTTIRDLMEDVRFTDAVLDFIRHTGVGCIGGGARVGPDRERR